MAYLGKGNVPSYRRLKENGLSLSRSPWVNPSFPGSRQPRPYLGPRSKYQQNDDGQIETLGVNHPAVPFSGTPDKW